MTILLVKVLRAQGALSRPGSTPAYLYLRHDLPFLELPETLRKTFEERDVALSFNLAARSELAGADIKKVRAAIESEGYFLQLPLAADAHEQRIEQGLARTAGPCQDEKPS